VGAYGTGEEALIQIALKKPDIVLMDIELPGISGIEVHSTSKGTLPAHGNYYCYGYNEDND